MGASGILSLLIIINTCIFSYRAFKNRQLFAKLEFDVDRVKLTKEYWRFISSGLVHLNWMHLIFNMLALFFFAGSLEAVAGPVRFLLIYVAGIIGGNLFALLIHRKHGDYTSVGASGGVNGVIFATIALFPNTGIGLFFIPLSIPGWVFALLFVAYSIYGVKSKKNNIGHEAHLGGALVGVFLAIAMYPEALIENYLPILAIVLPILIFTYLVVTRPHVLLVDNLFFKKHQRLTIDQEYNLNRRNQQMQLDEILDKIQKKGMQNLTKEELKKLKEFSKQL